MKVRCVKSYSSIFQEGEIYTIKNGSITYEGKGVCATSQPIRSIEDLKLRFKSQFELISNVEKTPAPQIIIYPNKDDKDRTTIILKDKGEVVKSTSVRRHSNDEYNFLIGAREAIDKLINEYQSKQAPVCFVLTKKTIDWDGFNAGNFGVRLKDKKTCLDFLVHCEKVGINVGSYYQYISDNAVTLYVEKCKSKGRFVWGTFKATFCDKPIYTWEILEPTQEELFWDYFNSNDVAIWCKTSDECKELLESYWKVLGISGLNLNTYVSHYTYVFGPNLVFARDPISNDMKAYRLDAMIDEGTNKLMRWQYVKDVIDERG